MACSRCDKPEMSSITLFRRKTNKSECKEVETMVNRVWREERRGHEERVMKGPEFQLTGRGVRPSRQGARNSDSVLCVFKS